MSGLLTCAEFRAIRDEQALKAMTARLPQLDVLLEDLWHDIAPIFKAYYQQTKKHEKDKVYARFEGRDVLYWRLIAERDAIEARLAEEGKR